MISPRAKRAILHSFSSGREVACVLKETEEELLALKFMQYTVRPLMKLTRAGRRYAERQERKYVYAD